MARWRFHHLVRRPIEVFGVALAVVAGLVVVPSAAAAATTNTSIDLRVLVLDDGASTNVAAIRMHFDRTGVPFDVVDLSASGRPVIDQNFLEDATANRGRYQGIVLANPAKLATAELAALTSYERAFGVREVDAYVYPNRSYGLQPPSYAGVLDGVTAHVTAAARADGFGYLRGPVTVDDVSASASEVYGYVASPATDLADGESYTPLLTASVGGSTGSVMGVHTAAGRSRLVITSSFSGHQRYFAEIAPGITSWLTRGIHLGYQRNYFGVHVDDVFAADNQWYAAGHCTPGDDCYGEFAGATTREIRMQPPDVGALVNWQSARGVRLDMVFNGGGSVDAMADSGLTRDPLLDAFRAHANRFVWINHTYSHEYLGCIQVAPPVVTQLWHCATDADYADPDTAFIEPDLAQHHAWLDPGTGLYFLTQDEINDQIVRNLDWANQNGFTVDPSELVTGEHSGLALSPQQPIDNPVLAPALAARGITALGADASRGFDPRMVGPAVTVPRHPLNVFYNVDTYRDQVSEYNWYYTSRADGGSGLCEDRSDIMTCIAPLADDSDSAARASYMDYIVPLETRTALSFILANDPRPFYVHQSNLTGDRILYPLLDDVLETYRTAYDDASTPLVQLSMDEQVQAMARMSRWQTGMDDVTAYLDAGGVHVAGSAAVPQVPVTVPAGTRVASGAFEPYGGELSGWVAASPGGTVIAVPSQPMGGYLGVPDAPAAPTAAAGDGAVDVSWSAPNDRGSAITGYVVRTYIGDNAVPENATAVAADQSSLSISGLANYTPYRFTVVATSAVGDSDESARSDVFVPVPSVPAAPAAPTVVAGDGTATVSWVAPADGGSPVTLYSVRLYVGDDATASSGADIAPDTTSTTFTGLTNGTAYTFDVFAYNAAGPGPASPRSAPATPSAPVVTTPTTSTGTAPTTTAAPPPAPPPAPPVVTPPQSTAGNVAPAPRLRSIGAGKGSILLRWSERTPRGTPRVTSFVINVYMGQSSTPVHRKTVKGSSRSATIAATPNEAGYTVDITAVNAAGASAPSTRSELVFPKLVVPAPPVRKQPPGS